MKVALVHDWITGLRGGERCLQAFLSIYPQADIFTLLHVPGSTDAQIDSRVKKTSFIQKIPGASRYYRALLPLYPLAISQFDFKGYDLVISLSHAAAKNVSVPKGVRHICFCFTPMRYIWDQAWSYFGKATPFLWPILKSLRSWDTSDRHQPDLFVAISHFIAARIRCFYGARAAVLYPAVETSWIPEPSAGFQKGEAFLLAGALVPYKRPDLVVEAFNASGEKLWVVGSGPEEAKLKRIAKPNIEFLGRVTDAELARYYSRCRALVFPGTEDFGMVPIECLAAGRPVIALYDGAARETLTCVKPWDLAQQKCLLDEGRATGVFIERGQGATLETLTRSLKHFILLEDSFNPQACRAQALRFAPSRFFSEWKELTDWVVSGKDPRQFVHEQNCKPLAIRELRSGYA